ncbi:hypothetical protein NliqN6_2150 [Naganishia liquefaciens]|uniref:non-specific serine/threonine protein kinase n=1 Tax=Naganishia liquefaciens TaxID=104408 RepID=A0A8H3YDZ9_9TREE|nr:hypothetical protein NliqN6_2150 [Naganishia liquefaciens]
MSSSGYKRSRDDESRDYRKPKREGLPYDEAGGESTDSRAKKPRDWRDAFLGDGERKRHKDAQIREHRESRQRESSADQDRRRERDHRHRSGRDSKPSYHPYTSKDDRKGSYNEKWDKYNGRFPTEADHGQDKEEGEIESPDASQTRSMVTTESKPVASGKTSGGDTQLASLETDSLSRERRGAVDVPVQIQAVAAQEERNGLPNPISAPEAIPEQADALGNVDDEPPDLEALLEERRRKRRELLERLAGTQSGVNSATPSSLEGSTGAQSTGTTGKQLPIAFHVSGLTIIDLMPIFTSVADIRASAAHLALSSNNSGFTTNARPSPSAVGEMEVAKADGRVNNELEVLPAEIKADTLDGEAQISAADYNPDDDRKLDDERRKIHDVQGHTKLPEESAPVEGAAKQAGPVEVDEDEYEEVEEDVEDDDDFDMFAVDDAPKKKRKVLRKKIAPQAVLKPAPVAATLVDNYDDSEGYYRITPGEVLDNGRYQITVNLGKGMFAQVMRAKVLKPSNAEEKIGQEVAIKVIRSQESMYLAGRKEAQILRKLVEADPEDKKHIVRLLRTFEHRGHFCLVTESLSMNLRDVVKRFGKDVGLNLRAVRAYAHQIFLALSLMKKCNVIHADLKPDNILVNENKAVLKVCDLGSACDAAEHEITPYLVSRFYRAPEIILGLPYDDALDMWSIGCTLYELYTGKILFPGKSNNHMLHLMMDLKGKFNHRMIKKAQFGPMHFDDGMNFVSIQTDKITGQDITKSIVISKATRDLKSRLMPPSNVQLRMKDDDLKLLTSFVDLLDKMLMLDPAKRISVREALLHPFLSG